MLADLAARAIVECQGASILDVGSGDGEQAEYFRRAGKRVTTLSLRQPADIVADFATHDFRGDRFDIVWASHVLEHQRNVGAFLDKCYMLLNQNGLLAVTVPPMKAEIVGGHVALFNAGLLLYHLVLAGFDCRDAHVRSYGYNVSVIVQKKSASLPSLACDCGDLERLRIFFPVDAHQGFDGNIERVNWPWH